jgi:hypothetical protein
MADSSNPESIVLSFLSDWLEWANNGATNFKPYSRRRGLCNALVVFCEKKNHTNIKEIQQCLSDMFVSDGLNKVLPFGIDNFIKHTKLNSFHECEVRKKWILQTLEQNHI